MVQSTESRALPPSTAAPPSPSAWCPLLPTAGLVRLHSAHLAVDAHAAALVDAVLVLAGIGPVHLGVVIAVVRVAVTVAGWREGPSAVGNPARTARTHPTNHG